MFLSSSAVVGNEVLCSCRVLVRNTMLYICRRFKNISSHYFDKPPSVDTMKLERRYSPTFLCTESTVTVPLVWLQLWFAASHFSMSHLWPREKNWPAETRKKAARVVFTNRGSGNQPSWYFRWPVPDEACSVPANVRAAGVSLASLLDLKNRLIV